MTLDLFADEPNLERLGIEDADISLVRQIDLGEPNEGVLMELVRATP